MKKKILFIEDDQVFANIYRNKLVLEGFEVEIAYDGQSGLDTLRTFKPDLVLLDLMLPKLSGIEVIRKVRVEPDLKELPVVVFTNTYLTSTVQEAWKAGATKCLTKASCTPNQVIGTLLTLLANNGTEKQPAAKSQSSPPGDPPSAAPPARAAARVERLADKDDSAFEAELRKTFIDGLPTTLAGLRAQLKSLIKADNDDARVQQIQELNRRIHMLTGSASIVGMLPIAQMADALEALLKELYEKPNNINASTIRTVATAIDFLGILFDQGTNLGQNAAAARVLVVDDEEISRRAITYALDKAKLKSVSMADPVKALDQASADKFDLIFLDVGMPNMNGFELCTRLRALPAYKKTPVVFVTSLNDFESRANSTMSGGNDFIAKPFLFIELTVKALVYIWRSRLVSAKN